MIELEQRTPEWYKFRREHIGASDAPYLMGVNKYKSPYQIWREKQGLDESNYINEDMQRGIDLEPEARKHAGLILNVELKPVVRKSRTTSFMAASLDGISDDGKILVEIKCPRNQIQGAEVPMIHYPQLQHQMYVCEAEKMYYFSYLPHDSVMIEIVRNDEYIEKLIQVETEFWDCVQNLTPPPSAYETKEDPLSCKAALHYRELDDKLKALEKEHAAAKEILIKIGDGKPYRCQGITVGKVVRKGNVDYASIVKEHNIDVEPFRKKPVEYWRIS